MGNFAENMDLGFVEEFTEEELTGFVAHMVQNGKPIMGYYGNPYINYHWGDAQYIIHLSNNGAENTLEFAGIDTHVAGHCVWRVRLNGIDFTPEGSLPTEKYCICSSADTGKGMVPINIVNADVLPSFMEDDIITLQVAAFAHDIDYFASDEEYDKTLKKTATGMKFGLCDGTIFPSGFMRNHQVIDGNVKNNKGDISDCYSLIKGTVKTFYRGKLNFFDDESEFVCCVIDTNDFGPLEIIHSCNQVKEGQHDNLKAGAVVSALVTLSGDAAIYEYSDGFVIDEENNLRLLRYSFSEGDPERLRLVLTENAEYVSDLGGATFTGPEKIVERLKHVNEISEEKYFAHMATISETKSEEKDLPYGPGKRCIILACGSEDNYESILFMDMNDEGMITRIHTSTESGYYFVLDEPPASAEPESSAARFDSYHIPMILRAQLHGFLEMEDSDEQLQQINILPVFDYHARLMLYKISKSGDKYYSDQLAFVFGYLFAKSIEKVLNSHLSDRDFAETYTKLQMDSALADLDYGEEINTKLAAAFDYGRQFLKDFNNYHDSDEENYEELLLEALAFIQGIGTYCAEAFLAGE